MEKSLTIKVLELIEKNDMTNLKKILEESDEIELLKTFHDLEEEEQVIIFRLLSKNMALNIFELLDTDEQQNLIKSFTNERVVEFLNTLAPDDRVKLLDEMPAGVAKNIIASLSKEEKELTNLLMGYEPETAGRIMTTEYISLNRDMTVEEAFKKIRSQASKKETIYTLYVTDAQKKLEGVLSLKDLIIAEPNVKIEEIMAESVVSVSTSTDQEKVANTLKELDLLALPVVDKEERIVGIVTIDDAIDILEEEATEDIYDQAGLADVTGNETNRSEVLIRGSLLKIWKVRLPFLMITLLAGTISGLVIGNFEEILESVAMVAFFIPMIMDMGGSVGTQSSTLFVRGVSLGQVNLSKFMKHLVKEILVGASIGIIVGSLAGIIATVWHNNHLLGLSVGLAIVATTTFAATLGFLVPYILIKLKIDQAAGSTPIITAMKDIAGLLIYFTIVSLLLGHMLY